MPQIEPPPVEPVPPFEIRQLIADTITNAKYLTPRMQNVIAKYLEYQSAPRMFIKTTGIDTKQLKEYLARPRVDRWEP